MQTFRVTKTQLGQLMREFNQSRKQSLKSIKQSYTEIQTKQHKVFDTAFDRLTLNLLNFKQNKYKKMHNQIDHSGICKRYQHKLSKIDREINKLDEIIKNGVGRIVEKPYTSRVSLSSNTELEGSQSRRTMDDFRMDSTLMYLKSPNIVQSNSATTLQNLDDQSNIKSN